MSKYSKSGVMMVYSDDDAEVGGEESFYTSSPTDAQPTHHKSEPGSKPSETAAKSDLDSNSSSACDQSQISSSSQPIQDPTASQSNSLHISASDLPENYFDDLFDIMHIPPDAKSHTDSSSKTQKQTSYDISTVEEMITFKQPIECESSPDSELEKDGLNENEEKALVVLEDEEFAEAFPVKKRSGTKIKITFKEKKVPKILQGSTQAGDSESKDGSNKNSEEKKLEPVSTSALETTEIPAADPETSILKELPAAAEPSKPSPPPDEPQSNISVPLISSCNPLTDKSKASSSKLGPQAIEKLTKILQNVQSNSSHRQPIHSLSKLKASNEHNAKSKQATTAFREEKSSPNYFQPIVPQQISPPTMNHVPQPSYTQCALPYYPRTMEQYYGQPLRPIHQYYDSFPQQPYQQQHCGMRPAFFGEPYPSQVSPPIAPLSNMKPSQPPSNQESLPSHELDPNSGINRNNLVDVMRATQKPVSKVPANAQVKGMSSNSPTLNQGILCCKCNLPTVETPKPLLKKSSTVEIQTDASEPPKKLFKSISTQTEKCIGKDVDVMTDVPKISSAAVQTETGAFTVVNQKPKKTQVVKVIKRPAVPRAPPAAPQPKAQKVDEEGNKKVEAPGKEDIQEDSKPTEQLPESADLEATTTAPSQNPVRGKISGRGFNSSRGRIAFRSVRGRIIGRGVTIYRGANLIRGRRPLGGRYLGRGSNPIRGRPVVRGAAPIRKTFVSRGFVSDRGSNPGRFARGAPPFRGRGFIPNRGRGEDRGRNEMCGGPNHFPPQGPPSNDGPPCHQQGNFPQQGPPPPDDGPPWDEPNHFHPQGPMNEGPPWDRPNDCPPQRPPNDGPPWDQGQCPQRGPPPPNDGPPWDQGQCLERGPPPPNEGPPWDRPNNFTQQGPPNDGPPWNQGHCPQRGPPPPNDGPPWNRGRFPQRGRPPRNGGPPWDRPHNFPPQRPPHINEGPPWHQPHNEFGLDAQFHHGPDAEDW